MSSFKLAKPILAALTACAVNFALGGAVFADTAQDNAQLKEQMRIMMQQMQEMQKQIQQLKQQQQPAPAPVVPAPPAPPAPGAPLQGPKVPAKAPAEPAFEKFVKGFYGTLDVSTDYATKGMSTLGAYHFSPYDPADPTSYVITGQKGNPVGRVGWQADLSTNKSVIGYRGSHKIPDTTVDFIYQLEVQPQITHAPGVSTGYTSQSDVTKGGIGYGDSFIGVSNDKWGKLKVGTTYTPYKKSTDRMNPFSGMLGDYGAFMGNTGGDNRVEFGSRIDHSIWYESPKFGGLFSFDVLFSPGQNRTPYNEGQSSGSPDCTGGNVPGSGNLPLACADGAYDNAWSFDIKFEHGPIYFTAAYEIHQGVNRSSDGIGSNSPYYNSLFAINNIVDPVSGAVLSSTCSTTSPIIDCGGYNAYSAEYPQAATFGTPGYINDIANETAFKTGLQYTFDFGLAVSGIYEAMRRKLESDLMFQNERQRNGFWFAASQDFTEKDNFSIGWAHASASVGDPGGQHNYDPRTQANYANMYTAAWKHRFDKNLYWYFDVAQTVNHDNAHYDIGAGGRGVTTDCHDGTTYAFVDYSSAGPTTWGGCRPLGFSTGLHYTF